MKKSLEQQLENVTDCENILNCLYGLNDLDIKCYTFLLDKNKALSATELSQELNRHTSTIHRSLDRLEEHNLITKEKQSLDTQGYEYRFSSIPPEEVSQNMEELIKKWNNMATGLITEFEEKYT